MDIPILKTLKHLRICSSILQMKARQKELFAKGLEALNEDRIHDLLDIITELRILCRSCKKSSKSYFYGITITRNPNEQTVEEFIQYAEKFHSLKSFQDSTQYSWGYECFDKNKNLINEHVHIFLDAGKYFSIKDFKKSFRHRIEVNRLYGEAVYQTANYIQKDNNCEFTKSHYSNYLDAHFGAKE